MKTETIVFWLSFMTVLVISGRRLYHYIRLIRLGRGVRKLTLWNERIKTALILIPAQWSNLRNISTKDLAGLGHILIFWGTLVFTVNLSVHIFIGDGLGLAGEIRNTNLARIPLFLSDIFAPVLAAAFLAALFRRVIIKPDRLKPNLDSGPFLILTAAVLLFLACYLAVEGLRLNLGLTSFRTPMAGLFADTFNAAQLGRPEQTTIFRGLWWLQYALLLGFLIYAPRSKHKHPLFSPFNILFNSDRPCAVVKKIDLEANESWGAAQVSDFSWKQLLEGFACAQCGRCQENCPAYLTGKPLSPKKLILDMNAQLLGPANGRPPGSRVPTVQPSDDHLEAIHSCTTCGACADVCPVLNRPFEHIIELRRNQVFQGHFDPGHKNALKRVARNYNPWGAHWKNRGRYSGLEPAVPGEKYECLYWLGCSASFDETAGEIARATIELLHKGGVKTAILGINEKCCGDFVRRLGDEGLFQQLAIDNIARLSEIDFRYILTHCPHCYNTLANEYPDFGGHFRVVHHTSLIRDLVREEKIQLYPSRDRVIYHDPCYLGRHNGLYDAPRQVLSRVFRQVYEFPRNKAAGFCCGAGGGHMWKERENGRKISLERVREAQAVSPQILATACPFCLLMSMEALQLEGYNDLKAIDIAVLVEKHAK